MLISFCPPGEYGEISVTPEEIERVVGYARSIGTDLICWQADQQVSFLRGVENLVTVYKRKDIPARACNCGHLRGVSDPHDHTANCG